MCENYEAVPFDILCRMRCSEKYLATGMDGSCFAGYDFILRNAITVIEEGGGNFGHFFNMSLINGLYIFV